MNTLAKLRNEAERLRQGRKVFVSSESVSAYKVANNKKQLLEGDHPLVLSLPDDDYSSGANLSLLEASVGPELHWTLSSINHVLRTASKWGEPTYLFANILDTDPQAFVAVTLNKRTSTDELEHLEGVMSRVCHFHVAESKPMQVPGPDQVVSALGKGLMKLVFGGSSSSSSSKHKGSSSSPTTSPPPRTTLQQLQQQQTEASSKTAEQERADYLASLEQRRGAHVATAGDRSGGYGTHAGVQGDDTTREGEYVPTAPVLPVNRTAMGVGSKQEADARLAALKADIRGEGGAPSAPGVYASSSDTRPSRPSAYPTIPTDDAAAPQQHQGPPPNWQAHTPGTLSNPFTGGSSSNRAPESQYPNRAPDLAASTPSAPHTISYEDYLSRYEQWGANRLRASHKTPEAAPAGVYDTRDYADAGWGGQGSRDQRGSSRQAEADDREQRRLRYEEEARQAREGWERAQREAAAKRAAAESAPPSKPRVRYHEVQGDGGWGGGSRQPAYAYSGAPGGQQQQQDKHQQQQQGKQQAPDWLEVLGKVFAGGPAYANYAPDL